MPATEGIIEIRSRA